MDLKILLLSNVVSSWFLLPYLTGFVVVLVCVFLFRWYSARIPVVIPAGMGFVSFLTFFISEVHLNRSQSLQIKNISTQLPLYFFLTFC